MYEKSGVRSTLPEVFSGRGRSRPRTGRGRMTGRGRATGGRRNRRWTARPGGSGQPSSADDRAGLRSVPDRHPPETVSAVRIRLGNDVPGCTRTGTAPHPTDVLRAKPRNRRRRFRPAPTGIPAAGSIRKIPHVLKHRKTPRKSRSETAVPPYGPASGAPKRKIPRK